MPILWEAALHMPRILIIEDDSSTRELMEQTLKASGHEVFLAADGKPGLALHRAVPMDLIITDIYMPEMEGLEVINRLRREGGNVPIIAISGNPDLLSALDIAKKLGAAKIMAKPFRPEQLRAAVNLVLSQWAKDPQPR